MCAWNLLWTLIIHWFSWCVWADFEGFRDNTTTFSAVLTHKAKQNRTCLPWPYSLWRGCYVWKQTVARYLIAFSRSTTEPGWHWMPMFYGPWQRQWHCRLWHQPINPGTEHTLSSSHRNHAYSSREFWAVAFEGNTVLDFCRLLVTFFIIRNTACMRSFCEPESL